MMKGRHGFNKKGGFIHEYGCFPRAISIAFGDQLRLSYSEIVEICKTACRMRGCDLDFNSDAFYHGIGERDAYEVAKALDLRFVGMLTPMPMKYGACLWANYVAVINSHAVPYRASLQVGNAKPYPEGTLAHYFIAPPDGGHFTL